MLAVTYVGELDDSDQTTTHICSLTESSDFSLFFLFIFSCSWEDFFFKPPEYRKVFTRKSFIVASHLKEKCLILLLRAGECLDWQLADSIYKNLSSVISRNDSAYMWSFISDNKHVLAISKKYIKMLWRNPHNPFFFFRWIFKWILRLKKPETYICRQQWESAADIGFKKTKSFENTLPVNRCHGNILNGTILNQHLECGISSFILQGTLLLRKGVVFCQSFRHRARACAKALRAFKEMAPVWKSHCDIDSTVLH